MAVALTSLSHGAGCGCKIPAAQLGPLVAALAPVTDPALLVGTTGSEDAAVYRLREDLAVVQTVDFFTPIVDDAYDFGRIAAANALSDIYAMGATPITALNLVAFSLAELGSETLVEILRGGQHSVTAAGASIVGGHSIDDREPKYGLAVTGLVHPDEILTNSGGQAGDLLVLSKPLGAGVASTAAKRGLAGAELVARATAVMCELNRDAAAAARAAGAHALTDVTGFGLLGHLHELAGASGLAAVVEAAALPAIEGVLELLGGQADAVSGGTRGNPADVVSGGTRANRTYAETFSTFVEGVQEARRWLAVDAMTSGGLLAAVPASSAGAASGTVIGRLAAGPAGTIRVE